MMIVDTNVLLRAALDDDPSQAEIAKKHLAGADHIAIPLQAICEFVWVMSRSYKLGTAPIVDAVLKLINDEKVTCNRQAIAAGLDFILNGGDFADGVIEFEGRRLGGQTFLSFDRNAISFIRSKGRDCLLLGGA